MVKKVKHKDIRGLFSPKGASLAVPGSSQEPETLHIFHNHAAAAVEEERTEAEEPATKRLKTAADIPDAAGKKKKTTSNKPLKCDVCNQLLKEDTLKVFSGDELGAAEEFIALASEALSLFDANSNGESEWSEKPQHRITNFSVYDQYGHLCPFDTGLVDKNVQLFFSGYIKPIYDDTPSLEGGVQGARLGPIDAWYIAGFDGGERELIGFTTVYADYLLSHPSEEYTAIFDSLREKSYLSKTVIEILEEDSELNMEDLINRIQLVVPPENCPKFSEETLLKHAQFLVEQIESYDRAGEDDEELLITVPAVRGLIKLAGVTLGTRAAAQTRQPTKTKAPGKTKSSDISPATVTPLVQASFEQIFTDQMYSADKSRKKRCNECAVCLAPDCGECSCCKDMLKFGGTGKRRQACSARKCPNMAVQNAEESEEEEEDDKHTDQKKLTNGHSKKHANKPSDSEGSFTGEILYKKGSKTFYKSAEVEGFSIEQGDYVSLAPDTPGVPDYIGRVIYMYSKSGGGFLHLHWLSGVQDTVLGAGAHDKFELFLSDMCDDAPLGSVISKVAVKYTPPPPNWSMMGGLPVPEKEEEFYFKFWYDTEKGRFEEPLSEYLDWNSADGCCPACVRRAEADRMLVPTLDEKHVTLTYKHVTYTAGDYVYLDTDAYSMPNRTKSNTIPKIRKDKVDDEMYPEYYRKSDYIKGSNELVPEPYRIARIVSFSVKQDSLDASSCTVKVSLKKLYRPENVTNRCIESADINLLYYSNDQVKLKADKIAGKCTVKHSEEISELSSYSRLPDHFYVAECYNSSSGNMEEVPAEARASNKGKRKAARKEPTEEVRKLRTLDVFAGCGGLSEGFHQAGIAESSWAIEFFSEAAQAYKLNNPGAVVFNEDCNVVLKMAMEGVETNKLGQRIPRKGEVELLCGGPPCQGFSGMNRFNAREYSMFKNSLISSYLSYCEYYRPRYFLLENVRNFVSYKKNMVLKLCLSSLVNMGYQCTFGVLQAGSYGVSQTRRRAFLLAAAPGEVLPQYPEPKHVFSPKAMSLSVMVDEKQYKSHITRYSSAPLKNITVRDIMSDLPCVTNGANKREMGYDKEPCSWFQRQIRRGADVLTDHICKEMNPLVAMRMRYIPLTPGSDWRDLPNISVTLPDGRKTAILVYTHNDSKGGPLKGVCSCAENRKCDPMDKQMNTLIPWCLPHTGNRHNHWAGLYGRVFWDGFFSTTITNPEPMGKQGRVLHPEQHRLVSVRECARSQGFPDSYKFYGNLLDKHRQVGNAVPPPLAKAIGEEIRKSLVAVARRRKLEA